MSSPENRVRDVISLSFGYSSILWDFTKSIASALAVSRILASRTISEIIKSGKPL